MTRLPADLQDRLATAAPAGTRFSVETDRYGVSSAWCELADHHDLLAVAAALREQGARLSMITGSQPPPPPEVEEEEETPAEGEEAKEAAPKELAKSFGGTALDGTSYEITYHFHLAGDTLTLVAFVPAGDTLASLTALFRGADWPEREIMETYDLTFTGHPNPVRLFLDEGIEGSVMQRLVPLSTLVNASSSKDLWAKVMEAAKGSSAKGGPA